MTGSRLVGADEVYPGSVQGRCVQGGGGGTVPRVPGRYRVGTGSIKVYRAVSPGAREAT